MSKTPHLLIQQLEVGSKVLVDLQLARHLKDRKLTGLFLNLATRADHQKIV